MTRAEVRTVFAWTRENQNAMSAWSEHYRPLRGQPLDPRYYPDGQRWSTHPAISSWLVLMTLAIGIEEAEDDDHFNSLVYRSEQYLVRCGPPPVAFKLMYLRQKVWIDNCTESGRARLPLLRQMWRDARLQVRP